MSIQTHITAEHTPGPWRDGNEAIHTRIDRVNPWSGTVFRVSEMSDARALVCMTFGATPEECAATARLIAAAPELLKALIRAEKHVKTSCLYSETFPEWHEDLALLQAAIAKARGQ